MKPVVLQIYDYAQMFDSIDLEEALIIINDVGVNDDTLGLLHQDNAEVYMGVKTPKGLTERQVIKDIVLQGDTFHLGQYWPLCKLIRLVKNVWKQDTSTNTRINCQ